MRAEQVWNDSDTAHIGSGPVSLQDVRASYPIHNHHYSPRQPAIAIAVISLVIKALVGLRSQTIRKINGRLH